MQDYQSNDLRRNNSFDEEIEVTNTVGSSDNWKGSSSPKEVSSNPPLLKESAIATNLPEVDRVESKLGVEMLEFIWNFILNSYHSKNITTQLIQSVSLFLTQIVF